MKLKKWTALSVLVAVGFALSPILRIPGMAPMQGFINVVMAVLLGPWYALLGAIAISILRMCFFGINFLAVTGSVFGATLSGLLYRYGGRLIFATIGEIIGTGLIGSLVTYPVMTYLFGAPGLTWVTYVPSFIAGASIGSITALIFLKALTTRDLLKKLQESLK